MSNFSPEYQHYSGGKILYTIKSATIYKKRTRYCHVSCSAGFNSHYVGIFDNHFITSRVTTVIMEVPMVPEICKLNDGVTGLFYLDPR